MNIKTIKKIQNQTFSMLLIFGLSACDQSTKSNEALVGNAGGNRAQVQEKSDAPINLEEHQKIENQNPGATTTSTPPPRSLDRNKGNILCLQDFRQLQNQNKNIFVFPGSQVSFTARANDFFNSPQITNEQTVSQIHCPGQWTEFTSLDIETTSLNPFHSEKRTLEIGDEENRLTIGCSLDHISAGANRWASINLKASSQILFPEQEEGAGIKNIVCDTELRSTLSGQLCKIDQTSGESDSISGRCKSVRINRAISITNASFQPKSLNPDESVKAILLEYKDRVGANKLAWIQHPNLINEMTVSKLQTDLNREAFRTYLLESALNEFMKLSASEVTQVFALIDRTDGSATNEDTQETPEPEGPQTVEDPAPAPSSSSSSVTTSSQVQQQQQQSSPPSSQVQQQQSSPPSSQVQQQQQQEQDNDTIVPAATSPFPISINSLQWTSQEAPVQMKRSLLRNALTRNSTNVDGMIRFYRSTPNESEPYARGREVLEQTQFFVFFNPTNRNARIIFPIHYNESANPKRFDFMEWAEGQWHHQTGTLEIQSPAGSDNITSMNFTSNVAGSESVEFLTPSNLVFHFDSTKPSNRATYEIDNIADLRSFYFSLYNFTKSIPNFQNSYVGFSNSVDFAIARLPELRRVRLDTLDRINQIEANNSALFRNFYHFTRHDIERVQKPKAEACMNNLHRLSGMKHILITFHGEERDTLYLTPFREELEGNHPQDYRSKQILAFRTFANRMTPWAYELKYVVENQQLVNASGFRLFQYRDLRDWDEIKELFEVSFSNNQINAADCVQIYDHLHSRPELRALFDSAPVRQQ